MNDTIELCKIIALIAGSHVFGGFLVLATYGRSKPSWLLFTTELRGVPRDQNIPWNCYTMEEAVRLSRQIRTYWMPIGFVMPMIVYLPAPQSFLFVAISYVLCVVLAIYWYHGKPISKTPD